MRVSYSIIGANFRTNGSPASDCSGTPDLLDKNLVSNKSGCNPIGEVLEFAPNVDSLADNGGPTETMALSDVNEALDAVALSGGKCPPATNDPSATLPLERDQRGTGRPFGAGCDLGAYELSRLDVDVEMTVDATNYAGLPGP